MRDLKVEAGNPSQRALLLALTFVSPFILLGFVGLLPKVAASDDPLIGAKTAAVVQDRQIGDHQISFTLATPVVAVEDGNLLDVDGLDVRRSRPGYPDLPYFATYIVLPPEAQARLSVELANPVIQSGVELTVDHEQTFLPLPLTGEEIDDSSQVSSTNSSSLKAAIGSQGLYPTQSYAISEPMMVRDVRLVRLNLYPLRYDPDRGQLATTPEMKVTIKFDGDAPSQSARPAASHNEQHIKTLSTLVLNPEQLADFRSLPTPEVNTGSELPLDKDLYKIAVIEDGIHEITFADLQAAGMAVGEVDPATFEMQYRGHPIAFEFVGDADDQFESGESIRFYGFGFDGSRQEKQFVSQNIFWLWAGAVSNQIATIASISGQPISTYSASLTYEPENVYFPGYTTYWPENEPDAWYWDYFNIYQTPLTKTYTVTLPHPVSSGAQARFTVELSSRDSHVSDQEHHVRVAMNGHPNIATRSWYGELNFNLTAAVPLSNVLAGTNHFDIRAQTEGTRATIALNRITVDYSRKLIADNNQLIFDYDTSGVHQFTVQGFTQPDARQVMVWELTDPYSPTAILSETVAIEGDGPYSYTFGVEHAGDARFIATTTDNVFSPVSISEYTAPALDPVGGADWLAIAYGEFLTETMRLAGHRSEAAFGDLKTHVVNVADVINQFSSGLPVPAAIQNYLSHALSTWTVKPSYLLLVGDTTLDPRHINPDWTDEQYLLTDLVFEDRYQGLIPSDLTFALVSGADLLPDLSVGRIAAENQAELASAIDKIIRYDENQRLAFGWMENFVFLADKFDPDAGDFCLENQYLSDRLPESMDSIFMCLDDYSSGGTFDADALRGDFISFLENTGATMVTYRGHGSVANWGGDPSIFRLANVPELNNQHPFVAISGDCLDGHYAYPPWEGLGERLLSSQEPPGAIEGAAAHWGSSGLGITSDHTDILNGFYDGIFGAGATAIGDAVTHAKLAYAADPLNDPALLYSFNLQGDPAMHLLRPNLMLDGGWQQAFAQPDEQVTLAATVQNLGVYPAAVSLASEAPPGFALEAVSSTISSTVAITGGGAEITLQFGPEPNGVGIPRNAQATVSITYQLVPDAELGRAVGEISAHSSGLDAWQGDEVLTSEMYVVKRSLWLPALIRQ